MLVIKHTKKLRAMPKIKHLPTHFRLCDRCSRRSIYVDTHNSAQYLWGSNSQNVQLNRLANLLTDIYIHIYGPQYKHKYHILKQSNFVI